MTRQDHTAGKRAQSKYDELVRSWRRRKRTLFVLLGLLCGSVLILSFVAAQHWPGAGWTFGTFGGSALALWIIAFLSPPGWMENWQIGAWGEQATAKVLRKLEREGWIVLHDLPSGHGNANVDHIAIGPGGVYLLDSKQLGGSVTIDGDGAAVRRIDDPDLSYRFTASVQISRLARQTHDRILAHSRLKIWVSPVIVVWSDFPQRVVDEGQCAYVHGDELVAWLRARSQVIAHMRIAQVADSVRSSFAPELHVSHDRRP
jgi:hypothetical protein